MSAMMSERLVLATSPIDSVCLPTCRRDERGVSSIGRTRGEEKESESGTHELHLEEVLELELDGCDGDAHVLRLDLEDADLVRADRDRYLVKLLGRVLVDREEDALVVQLLGRVLVRPKGVALALLLKLTLVARLHRPRQDEALLPASG